MKRIFIDRENKTWRFVEVPNSNIETLQDSISLTDVIENQHILDGLSEDNFKYDLKSNFIDKPRLIDGSVVIYDRNNGLLIVDDQIIEENKDKKKYTKVYRKGKEPLYAHRLVAECVGWFDNANEMAEVNHLCNSLKSNFQHWRLEMCTEGQNKDHGKCIRRCSFYTDLGNLPLSYKDIYEALELFPKEIRKRAEWLYKRGVENKERNTIYDVLNKIKDEILNSWGE